MLCMERTGDSPLPGRTGPSWPDGGCRCSMECPSVDTWRRGWLWNKRERSQRTPDMHAAWITWGGKSLCGYHGKKNQCEWWVCQCDLIDNQWPERLGDMQVRAVLLTCSVLKDQCFPLNPLWANNFIKHNKTLQQCQIAIKFSKHLLSLSILITLQTRRTTAWGIQGWSTYPFTLHRIRE